MISIKTDPSSIVSPHALILKRSPSKDTLRWLTRIPVRAAVIDPRLFLIFERRARAQTTRHAEGAPVTMLVTSAREYNTFLK